jgi:hypothetical protein
MTLHRSITVLGGASLVLASLTATADVTRRNAQWCSRTAASIAPEELVGLDTDRFTNWDETNRAQIICNIAWDGDPNAPIQNVEAFATDNNGNAATQSSIACAIRGVTRTGANILGPSRFTCATSTTGCTGNFSPTFVGFNRLMLSSGQIGPAGAYAGIFLLCDLPDQNGTTNRSTISDYLITK